MAGVDKGWQGLAGAGRGWGGWQGLGGGWQGPARAAARTQQPGGQRMFWARFPQLWLRGGVCMEGGWGGWSCDLPPPPQLPTGRPHPLATLLGPMRWMDGRTDGGWGMSPSSGCRGNRRESPSREPPRNTPGPPPCSRKEAGMQTRTAPTPVPREGAAMVQEPHRAWGQPGPWVGTKPQSQAGVAAPSGARGHGGRSHPERI